MRWQAHKMARGACGLVGLAIALLSGVTSAHAHLVVAQKGTLNLSGDGAYLAVSLPVAGLAGVDDDGDGLLSTAELGRHAAAIATQVGAGLRLRTSKGACPLEGIMLSLSPDDGREGMPAKQIIVMGRYAVPQAERARLVLRSEIWGDAPAERALAITITTDLKGEQVLLLTTAQRARRLQQAARARQHRHRHRHVSH